MNATRVLYCTGGVDSPGGGFVTSGCVGEPSSQGMSCSLSSRSGSEFPTNKRVPLSRGQFQSPFPQILDPQGGSPFLDVGAIQLRTT